MWTTSMGNHGAAGVSQNAGVQVVLVLFEEKKKKKKETEAVYLKRPYCRPQHAGWSSVGTIIDFHALCQALNVLLQGVHIIM